VMPSRMGLGRVLCHALWSSVDELSDNVFESSTILLVLF
jgi:hypothetical protein